jgi:hypothetical protein
METLIQSFLGIAARLNSPIHIRYWERQGEPTRSSRNGKEGELAAQTGSNGLKTSHVIIRQPYLFLEPVVRSFFEGAEDVRVISDRRFRERRQAPAPGVVNRRTPARDRRVSAPMLDILITVDP